MDRFKFRVWDNKTQSYKYKFDLTDGCYELDYIFNGMKFSEECSMYPLVGIDKNDFGIIEQCTGLKDKNGKLIYENDYLKIRNQTGTIFIRVRVDFYMGCFMVYDSDNSGNYLRILFDECWEIEIIGNIHEK